MGASWMLLYEAYARIGVGIASLLYYCGPVIVMVLSPLIFKEKLSAYKVFGFLAVLIGVFLVNGNPFNGNTDMPGMLCGLLSAVMYSLMVMFNKKATIEPQVYCGKCYPCRHGKYNLCEELKVMGFQTTGTASEYFAVDASKVTTIPEEMSFEEGAMIEPLAVAVHGVKQVGDVTGMNIVVIGAGPIGNLVAQAAKGMGAAKVMVTDVSDLRLEKAKECGVDICVNTMNKDFGEAMLEAFGPDKADVIYDCAGNNITMGQAIKHARKGSIIVLVAVFAGMAELDLAVANDHELDIKSTMMYRHDDYLDGIRLVNEGRVQLRPLISKTFAFRDYLKAYQYIDNNRETTMKVIINVQE